MLVEDLDRLREMDARPGCDPLRPILQDHVLAGFGGVQSQSCGRGQRSHILSGSKGCHIPSLRASVSSPLAYRVEWAGDDTDRAFHAPFVLLRRDPALILLLPKPLLSFSQATTGGNGRGHEDRKSHTVGAGWRSRVLTKYPALHSVGEGNADDNPLVPAQACREESEEGGTCLSV